MTTFPQPPPPNGRFPMPGKFPMPPGASGAATNQPTAPTQPVQNGAVDELSTSMNKASIQPEQAPQMQNQAAMYSQPQTR